MSNKLQELKEYLESMFELDQADLDFGIYRIMNQKREEIKDFLDNRLVPEVKEAFKQYQAADKEAVQKEIEELKQKLEGLGVNPEDSKQYQDLKEKLNQSVDLSRLENEVYSHLVNFFQRYYDNGDFISQRRYKKDVYAIPYEGEEVKLHWANADQYYIKTSEYFQNYTFVLPSGRRVHFKLVEASTEKDNNKEPNGKERKFVLVKDEPMEEVNGELILKFLYQPVEGKVKQDDLNTEAVKRILNYDDFKEWRHELAELKPTKNNGERTLLEKHIKDYTARNTFDYFIHKDLGGFLRRELDFYIKNEIMYLDDLDSENEVHFEKYISKVKVIKRIANKIITFLEQLENFQKKLWLKKKFIVESNYCITLDRVPKELYPDIVANQEQIEEWKRLFAIDEIKDYTVPVTVEFLKTNPYLVLDTACFSQDFKERLLRSIDNLDENIDGLLVHGENFQALNLLQQRYREQVGCIYIDPPYNTGNDEFLYKDKYQHSSWLSMIQDRVKISNDLLVNEGVFFASIDENEQARLELLLSSIFSKDNYVSTFVWEAGRKNDSKMVSVSHEYMELFVKNRQLLKDKDVRWRVKKEGVDEIYKKAESLKRQHGDNYNEISRLLKEWFNGLPDNHPSKRHKHYNCVDKYGVYFPSDISWPGGGGPRYNVYHPITKKPCKIPARGWMYPTFERMEQAIEDDLVHFWEDEKKVPCSKSYLKNNEEQAPNSVFYKDNRAAKKKLRHIMGKDLYHNPKDDEIIAERIGFCTSSCDLILDYFAGSGVVGNSVINLNKYNKGKRKYILIEMGDHFYTVMKPRIQKVIYSIDWNNGKPVSREGTSHIFKYIRLESYEDALNNLKPKRSKAMQNNLDSNPAFYEEYLLKYMLDFETKDSASLLNIDNFKDPFNYKLNIIKNHETKECVVDLVDTFNYLLGLKVDKLEARERYNAVKDSQAERPDAVKLRGARDGEAQFTFQVVEGVDPDGDKVLVIWRTLTGDPVLDNAALDAYFEGKHYNTRDFEFKRIYVNGDNNLDNFKADQEQCKVLLTEEEFKRRMFDIQDV